MPANEWTGFHRIEQALWVDGTTDGHRATRRPSSLDRRARRCRPWSTDVELEPAQIANGAVELLNEVSTLEDHRRGGALLAHRPRRLRGQRRGRAGGVRRGEAAPRGDERGARRATIDSRVRRGRRRRSTATARGDGFVSYTEPHDGDTQARSPGDRRARRAALAGGRLDRRGAVSRSVAARAALARRAAAPAARASRARRRRHRRAAATRRPARRRDRPVPRRAPGRDRDAGAGPAALRRVRRDAPSDADELRDLLRAWTRRGRADDRRASLGRRRQRRPAAPPDDTGEALGPRARRGSRSRSASGRRCSTNGDRFGLAARAARRRSPTCRAFAGRRARPGALAAATSASRPAPTTRRSRSTPSATSPASAAASSSCAGRSSASAARRRTSRAQDDAAQPDGLQGRHQQPQARGRRRALARARLGRPRRRPGVDARRHATWSRAGSGCCSRSGTAPRSTTRRRRSAASRSSGAPLGGSSEHDAVDLAARRRRRARDPGRRPHPARGAVDERRRCASCAAATRSPTASTRATASSTPACSSSPSSATRDAVRPDPAAPRRRDALNEYIRHTGSAVFACPPGVREGGFVGETLL